MANARRDRREIEEGQKKGETTQQKKIVDGGDRKENWSN